MDTLYVISALQYTKQTNKLFKQICFTYFIPANILEHLLRNVRLFLRKHGSSQVHTYVDTNLFKLLVFYVVYFSYTFFVHLMVQHDGCKLYAIYDTNI